MWSKKMVFCAFAMALILPLSAVADEPGLETVEEPAPVQPTGGAICDPALPGQDNRAGVVFGEPLKVEQLIAPRDGDGISGIEGERAGYGGCQYETCDFSDTCWDGCLAQWCGNSWPCTGENSQENFCWCVRSCSDICV